MIYFMINLTVILKISFVIRYKLTWCIALTLLDDMKTVLKHSGLHTCFFTILFLSSNARRVLAYTAVYKKTVTICSKCLSSVITVVLGIEAK